MMRLALVLLLIAGCTRSRSEPDAAPPPVAAASPTAPASDEPPSQPKVDLPADGGLAALLGGHVGPRQLLVEAVPPDAGFDRGLRERLTAGGPNAEPSPSSGDVRISASTATVPVVDADRVFAGLRPRFRSCYRVGLQTSPAMTGKLVVVLEVAPGGEVVEATATANTGISPAVATCVCGVVKRAQLPARAAPSRLSVPLTFVLQP